MKKNGFTLAEVLITLAIIGVVATITLPALMTNTSEQQAVTAFKKTVNTLSEVGQMSAAVDGFDYSSISATTAPGPSVAAVDSTTGLTDQSIWGIMASRAQVDRQRAGTAITGTNSQCSTTNNIFFADGTVLCYSASTTTSAPDNSISAYIDTNGIKAPNRPFECDAEACLQNAKTVGDQFAVTLHGSSVLPGHVTFSNGAPTDVTADAKQNNAARWAMRK